MQGGPRRFCRRARYPAQSGHLQESPSVSAYLSRWGRFAFRRKWIVLPVWFVLFGVLAAAGGLLSKPMSTEFSMPSLPSERATEILDRQFPGMSSQFGIGTVSGSYVLEAP